MMRLAEKLALNSKFKYRMGAVIVKGNRVLGRGFNSVGRHNSLWTPHWEGSLHAEEAALLDALKTRHPVDLRGSTILVCRVGRNNNVGMAKPCKHCQEVLGKFGISEVIYTTSNGIERITL